MDIGYYQIVDIDQKKLPYLEIRSYKYGEKSLMGVSEVKELVLRLNVWVAENE